jgi:hypothetical protein
LGPTPKGCCDGHLKPWINATTNHRNWLLIRNKLPRVSRWHLKGTRSKDAYEVSHRMHSYYHYEIGFVANRSTIHCRSTRKFKQATGSNLNSQRSTLAVVEHFTTWRGSTAGVGW